MGQVFNLERIGRLLEGHGRAQRGRGALGALHRALGDGTVDAQHGGGESHLVEGELLALAVLARIGHAPALAAQKEARAVLR